MVFAPRPFRKAPARRRNRRGRLSNALIIALLIAGIGSLLTVASQALWPAPRRPMPSLFDRQATGNTLASASTRAGSPTSTPATPGSPGTSGSPAADAAAGARRSPLAGAGENLAGPLPARKLGESSTPAKAAGAGSTSHGKAADAAPESRAPIVSWDKAERHIGATVAIEGKVIDAHDTGKVCFLNFSSDTRKSFYVVIFREANAGWPQPPQTYFLNKNVRVTGRVSTYEGRPQIRVRSANQIEILKK